MGMRELEQEHQNVNVNGEKTRGRVSSILIGIAAICAFVIPLGYIGADGTLQLSFINIERVAQAGPTETLSEQLWLVFPLLAGVATIVLAIAASGITRGLGLFILGLITIVMGWMVMHSYLPENASPPVLLWGYLGLCFLLSGFGAANQYPGSRLARGVGAVGGFGLLIFILSPVLPSELGRLGILMPFRLMGESATLLTGTGMLFLIGFLMAGGIIAISCTFRNKPELVSWGNPLIICGFLIFAASLAGDSFRAVGPGVTPQDAIIASFEWGKMTFWATGVGLLLPIGLREVLVTAIYTMPKKKAGQVRKSEKTDKLSTLNSLLEEGILSREEYELKKKEILGPPEQTGSSEKNV